MYGPPFVEMFSLDSCLPVSNPTLSLHFTPRLPRGQDDDVADGLCEVYNWPTYPQLYVNGELVGGCDVMADLHAAGELKQMLDQA